MFSPSNCFMSGNPYMGPSSQLFRRSHRHYVKLLKFFIVLSGKVIRLKASVSSPWEVINLCDAGHRQPSWLDLQWCWLQAASLDCSSLKSGTRICFFRMLRKWNEMVIPSKWMKFPWAIETCVSEGRLEGTIEFFYQDLKQICLLGSKSFVTLGSHINVA